MAERGARCTEAGAADEFRDNDSDSESDSDSENDNDSDNGGDHPASPIILLDDGEEAGNGSDYLPSNLFDGSENEADNESDSDYDDWEY
ncbi:hypothetical protein PHISCL_04632 [Aspergillus sclerotialis]|uniref:Uncharacterized protein n=1 Tax=Aspergillus sclerotialis TaxID=2070753 RepID=A0A3A2ZNP3_9EURO|nr:hypothetical protein PHISCL_04632 [Aspergillus sclerotialis]